MPEVKGVEKVMTFDAALVVARAKEGATALPVKATVPCSIVMLSVPFCPVKSRVPTPVLAMLDPVFDEVEV